MNFDLASHNMADQEETDNFLNFIETFFDDDDDAELIESSESKRLINLFPFMDFRFNYFLRSC